MTQLLGPDANSRLVYALAGTDLRGAVGQTATIYTNAAGTVPAAINTYNSGTPTVPGALISGSTLVIDQYSLLPLFWFPDGVDTLYVKVGTGPVTLINAGYDARLDGMLPRHDGPVADGTSIRTRTIATTSTGNFYETVDSTLSNGFYDPVLQYGYNIGPSGSMVDATKPSFTTTWEGRWFNAASTHFQSEYHVQFNGSGLGTMPNPYVMRPISIGVDHTDGSISMAFQTTRTPQSAGPPLAFLDQTGASFATWNGSWNFQDAVVIAGGTNGILEIGDATKNTSVQISYRAKTAGSIQQEWFVNGVSTWLDYMPPGGGSTRYMRDSVNAKMHVTYTPGAGAGGGSTIFGCAVQALGADNVFGPATNRLAIGSLGTADVYIDAQNYSSNPNVAINIRTKGTGAIQLSGNTYFINSVGFNGTAPIAKPAVTGSRGGNAALASLLTALASYGLILDSTSA